MDVYILDSDRERPVREDNLDVWCQWMWDHKTDLVVARHREDDTIIMTVFTGCDVRLGEYPTISHHAPIVWKTMVISEAGGKARETHHGTGTREDALVMHKRVCRRNHVRYSIVPGRILTWEEPEYELEA